MWYIFLFFYGMTWGLSVLLYVYPIFCNYYVMYVMAVCLSVCYMVELSYDLHNLPVLSYGLSVW